MEKRSIILGYVDMLGTSQEDRTESVSMARTVVADWSAVTRLIRMLWVLGSIAVAGTWVVAITLYDIRAKANSQQATIESILNDLGKAEPIHNAIKQEQRAGDAILDSKITVLDTRLDNVESKIATYAEAISGIRAQISTGFLNIDRDLEEIHRQLNTLEAKPK